MFLGDCFLRLTKSQKVHRYNSEGDVDVGRVLRDLSKENNPKIKPVRYLMAPPPLLEDCFLRLTKSHNEYRYHSAGDVDVGRNLRDLSKENNPKINPYAKLMAPRLYLKIEWRV